MINTAGGFTGILVKLPQTVRLSGSSFLNRISRRRNLLLRRNQIAVSFGDSLFSLDHLRSRCSAPLAELLQLRLRNPSRTSSISSFTFRRSHPLSSLLNQTTSLAGGLLHS